MDTLTLRTTLPCLLLIIIGKTNSRIPEYNNYCGDITLLDQEGPEKAAGKVIYNYDRSPSIDCIVNLRTRTDSRQSFIAIKTKGLKKGDINFCKTNNTVTVISSTSYPPHRYYCSDPLITESDWTWFEPQAIISIKVYHRSPVNFQFEVEFFTLHYGDCDASSEVYCGACLDAALACSYGNKYCKQTEYGVCSDIPKDDTVSSAVPAVVTSAIFIILLMVVCCVFVRRKQLPCCQFGNSAASNGENVAERARAIFTVQLASRGVTSNDGHDNEAYESIDPSTFEPPPEYSSLDNIDQQGKSVTDDGELPPSYDDAVGNRAKYGIESE